MEHSELIELIKSFDKKELIEFEKFIKSPFFTSGKNISGKKLLQFFNEVTKFYPKFDSKNFLKEKIYKVLYPGLEYKDSSIRDLSSKLLSLAKQYLSVRSFLQSSFDYNHNITIEMFNRKLDKSFEKSVVYSREKLAKRKKDSTYYYDKFRLEDYMCAYMGRKSYSNSKEMEDMSEDFFRFVILRSLQTYMLLINQQTVVRYSYKKTLMNELLIFLENNINDYSDIPQIEIYYNLLKLFITNEEKYFHTTKKLKDKHIKSLDIVEQNDLYICLGNYCLKKIAEGDTNFNKERFEIDKQYLKSGLIDMKHYLKMPLFLSITMNAIAIKEYTWLEDFLPQYLERLPPDYRTFADNYMNAEIFYSKNEYEKALTYLSRINIDIPYYKQLIRNLTLKIYYDLNYTEEAMAIIDTSKRFISKDKELPITLKEDFTRYINYTRKLINIKNAEDIIMLKKEIENSPGFRNKFWIIEKLSFKA